MISVIITARKEPNTIAKAIESIVNYNYSKFFEEMELIQVSPDEETLNAGRFAVSKINNSKVNYIQLKDEDKGKPIALNKALSMAKGEIIVLTDGDVHFAEGALGNLVEPLKDPEIGGVTGRPKAVNSKETMMGYIGNLLSDAAHHKRMVSLTENPTGRSLRFIPKDKFFPMSGYIMAIRNLKIQVPEDVLADDAYISYYIFNKGMKLSYEPEAIAYIKTPGTLDDYLIQKKRSLGGFVQLWKYNIVKNETKSRSFWHELQYFWFPIKYATNLKEFFWSILFYPIRLYTWIMIWWERKILHKDFAKTWVRVESTK